MERRIFQVLVLALVIYAVMVGGDYEAFCPAGGMASITGQLVNARMSCQMSAVNIFVFLAVVVAVLLAGRLFCSFLCPLGSSCEGVTFLGRKIGFAKTLPRYLDYPLRAIKYVLLYFVLSKTFESSELFCKTFDPYHAICGGFPHETIPWVGVATILVVFVLGLFLRLFWCKYLCFFSAAQNVFSSLVAVVPALLYLFLIRFGLVTLSFDALFLLLCFFGYFGELLGHRILPLVKIERSESSCSSCGLCDSACPQGIEVSKYRKVDHIDCHLCGSCVKACPVKGSLYHSPFGGSYLAPLLILSLGILTFAAAQKWGGGESFATLRLFSKAAESVERDDMAVYERKGVESIHCYGSSMSFAYRLGKKSSEGLQFFDGIYGIETYASEKTFRVYYDPSKRDEDEIRAMIFKEGKLCLFAPSSVGEDCKEVSRIKMGIYGVVDDWDIYALKKKLSKSPGVFAFSTSFGEPVEAKIFYDASVLDTEALKKLVQSEEKVEIGGKSSVYPFDVAENLEKLSSLKREEFIETFFNKHSIPIAKATNEDEEIRQYALLAKGVDAPGASRSIRYLAWYLLPVEGILEVATGLSEDSKPLLIVKVIADEVDLEELRSRLEEKEWVFDVSGRQVDLQRPFDFEGDFKEIEAQE